MSKTTNEPQTPELDKAIFKLKKELGAVKKSSKNPFLGNKYADLNQHLALLEPLLQKHGLYLTQPVITNGVKNLVSTEVKHVESGEVVKSQMVLPETTNMQEVGKGVTYARRYTLNALFGMQSEDDDGEAAVGRGKRNIKSF